MAREAQSAEEIIQDIHRRRDELRSPADGAVFYTGGTKTQANDYAAQETEAGRPAVTIEGEGEGKSNTGVNGTPLGAELERRELYNDMGFRRRFDAEHGIDGPPEAPSFDGPELVWGEASRGYAEQAEGRVEVVIGRERIEPGSTFYRVEYDTLVHNEKVTTINGVDRRELAEIDKDAACDRLVEAHKARELERSADKAAKRPEDSYAAQVEAEKAATAERTRPANAVKPDDSYAAELRRGSDRTAAGQDKPAPGPEADAPGPSKRR